MKLLNLAEMNFVSGAGVIEDAGFKNLTAFLSWAKKSNIDPLSSTKDGKDFGIKNLYRDWCNERGFDAEASAALNGWKL